MRKMLISYAFCDMLVANNEGREVSWMDRPICQNCNNRKDKYCAIVDKYVARKSSCEKFNSKKRK